MNSKIWRNAGCFFFTKILQTYLSKEEIGGNTRTGKELGEERGVKKQWKESSYTFICHLPVTYLYYLSIYYLEKQENCWQCFLTDSPNVIQNSLNSLISPWRVAGVQAFAISSCLCVCLCVCVCIYMCVCIYFVFFIFVLRLWEENGYSENGALLKYYVLDSGGGVSRGNPWQQPIVLNACCIPVTVLATFKTTLLRFSSYKFFYI